MQFRLGQKDETGVLLVHPNELIFVTLVNGQIRSCQSSIEYDLCTVMDGILYQPMFLQNVFKIFFANVTSVKIVFADDLLKHLFIDNQKLDSGLIVVKVLNNYQIAIRPELLFQYRLLFINLCITVSVVTGASASVLNFLVNSGLELPKKQFDTLKDLQLFTNRAIDKGDNNGELDLYDLCSALGVVMPEKVSSR